MKKIEIHTPFHHFCKTPFGPVAILWSADSDRPGIFRVLLSMPEVPAGHILKSYFTDSISKSCTEIDRVADQITASLTGSDIRFSLDIARLDLCPPFQQKVLRAEHGILRGNVSTYQRIARHLGNHKVARAVGTALATNPFPILVPCHRAIRTDKTLGGYQGGLAMKRALLEMEGVLFDDKGRVIMEEFFY